MTWAPELLLPALERQLGFQERCVGAPSPCVYGQWRQPQRLFVTRNRLKSLIRNIINITALGRIQHSECTLGVRLVTSGVFQPRNKGVIILWLPHLGFLSRLPTPSLARRRGTIVPTRRRMGESLREAWISPISPAASTYRHLSEVPKWQTLSTQTACAGKREKLQPRYGVAHLFWLTAETQKDNSAKCCAPWSA